MGFYKELYVLFGVLREGEEEFLMFLLIVEKLKFRIFLFKLVLKKKFLFIKVFFIIKLKKNSFFIYKVMKIIVKKKFRFVVDRKKVKFLVIFC